jgi:hypothetical protein
MSEFNVSHRLEAGDGDRYQIIDQTTSAALQNFIFTRS